MTKSKQGYKLIKTSFGKFEEIPSDWEIVSLGDISTIKRGSSPRPIADQKYFGNGRGWIRISDVTKSKKYLEKTRDTLSKLGESKSVPVNPNDVIMSVEATIGKPIIVNMKACIHDGFIVFFNLDPSVNHEYLYYFLKNREKLTKTSGQMGSQFNINIKMVSEIKFYKPPLTNQQKIVSILSHFDELSMKYDAMIELTKKLKRSLIQQLLTKGIGHKKLKKLAVVPRFIDFTYPEDWNVKKLDDISIEIRDGPMGFALHAYDYVEKGIPVLRIQNLKNLTVTKKDLRYISKEKHDELKKSQVKPLDIVISKTGILGMIGILPKDYGPANLNQALARISLNDKTLVNYVTTFLSSNLPQQILSVIGSGRTVQSGLKLSDIKNLEIPFPSLEEQEKIMLMESNLDSKLKKLKSIKTELDIFKDNTSKYLLTGKIHV